MTSYRKIYVLALMFFAISLFSNKREAEKFVEKAFQRMSAEIKVW